MNEITSDIAFTKTVKALQTEYGSRRTYSKMEQNGGWESTVKPELAEFLSRLDMFYLGTSNAEGQPYIQYRGGSKGFLKVIDEKTLGFADFVGNQQFISTGNLRENPRSFIFLMDYENRKRVKIWGEARVVDDNSDLLDLLTDDSYPGKVERAIVFQIKAWDINCPQHIHQRIPKSQVATEIQGLKNKIAVLEKELAGMRDAI